MISVEVRQGTLGSNDIKSNNPRLTGGGTRRTNENSFPITGTRESWHGFQRETEQMMNDDYLHWVDSKVSPVDARKMTGPLL